MVSGRGRRRSHRRSLRSRRRIKEAAGARRIICSISELLGPSRTSGYDEAFSGIGGSDKRTKGKIKFRKIFRRTTRTLNIYAEAFLLDLDFFHFFVDFVKLLSG